MTGPLCEDFPVIITLTDSPAKFPIVKEFLRGGRWLTSRSLVPVRAGMRK